MTMTTTPTAELADAMKAHAASLDEVGRHLEATTVHEAADHLTEQEAAIREMSGVIFHIQRFAENLVKEPPGAIKADTCILIIEDVGDALGKALATARQVLGE